MGRSKCQDDITTLSELIEESFNIESANLFISESIKFKLILKKKYERTDD